MELDVSLEGENGPRALKLNAVKSSMLCTGTTSRAAQVLTRWCNVFEVPGVPRLLRRSFTKLVLPPLIAIQSSFETVVLHRTCDQGLSNQPILI